MKDQICPKCQFDRTKFLISLPSRKCWKCGFDFTVWQYTKKGVAVKYCPYCAAELGGKVKAEKAGKAKVGGMIMDNFMALLIIIEIGAMSVLILRMLQYISDQIEKLVDKTTDTGKGE